MFTNPRPEIYEIADYYKSDDYVVHTERMSNLINFLFLIVRRFSIIRKYNIIKNYNLNNRILDIGCGTGIFLNYCRKKGMEVTGIEPSETARKIAKEKYELINIYSVDNFKVLTNNYYGIITLWHVLEHVHDIDFYLKKIYSLLIDDGILIIALPNPESFDAQYYSSYWAAFDVPRHLYHFRKDFIIEYLKKYNFKLQKILPLKFDSYYISMLSEKYMKRKIKFLKTFIIGFISNLKACKTKDYSSLIYVFKKN